jgi:hypothetical protein
VRSASIVRSACIPRPMKGPIGLGFKILMNAVTENLTPLSTTRLSRSYRLPSIRFHKLYRSEQYATSTAFTLQGQKFKLESTG